MVKYPKQLSFVMLEYPTKINRFDSKVSTTNTHFEHYVARYPKKMRRFGSKVSTEFQHLDCKITMFAFVRYLPSKCLTSVDISSSKR